MIDSDAYQAFMDALSGKGAKAKPDPRRDRIIDALRQLDSIDTAQLVALGMGEAAAAVRAAKKHLAEAVK